MKASLFVIVGALLAGIGLLGDPGIYKRSLGISVNLWWGLVMLILGRGASGLVAARDSEA